MKLIVSFTIWTVWLIVAIPIGIPITALLLMTNWTGATTWFGNALYPRGIGSGHLGNSWYSEWVYMAVRNPCSNFGKYVLGVPKDADWPWYVDNKWIRYGWQTKENFDARTGTRKFYFNPFKIFNPKFSQK